jgi:hypothetical protein
MDIIVVTGPASPARPRKRSGGLPVAPPGRVSVVRLFVPIRLAVGRLLVQPPGFVDPNVDAWQEIFESHTRDRPLAADVQAADLDSPPAPSD